MRYWILLWMKMDLYYVHYPTDWPEFPPDEEQESKAFLCSNPCLLVHEPSEERTIIFVIDWSSGITMIENEIYLFFIDFDRNITIRLSKNIKKVPTCKADSNWIMNSVYGLYVSEYCVNKIVYQWKWLSPLFFDENSHRRPELYWLSVIYTDLSQVLFGLGKIIPSASARRFFTRNNEPKLRLK